MRAQAGVWCFESEEVLFQKGRCLTRMTSPVMAPRISSAFSLDNAQMFDGGNISKTGGFNHFEEVIDSGSVGWP